MQKKEGEKLRINYMHKISPKYNTCIVWYFINGEKYDLFSEFEDKCPNCESTIVEKRNTLCCIVEGCGKVNYFEVDIPEIYFYKEKKSYELNSINDVRKEGLLGDVKRNGLHHHICEDCGYNFYTIYY